MVKAVVLGAAGGIGQSLSLLLKTNPLITELGLYDIKGVQGVAADLSHISTPAKVVGFGPEDDGLHKVLVNTDVVIILAGVALVKPTHPSEDVMAHPSVSTPKVDFRDQLFNINAGILRDLAAGIATTSPKAFILIISNPVNSLVPLVSEVFKKHGVYDPKRLFGVTTLDVERASTFVAEALGTPAEAPNVVVPVVGGHSGTTIVPLLSQSSHPLPPNFSGYDELVHRVQYGGAEVVKAKEGKGSATLSTAHAVYELALKIIKANKGETTYVTPSYVDLTADLDGGAALREELGQEDLTFFSSRVQLGPCGVNKIYGIGTISDAESVMVKAVIPQLVTSISKGIGFMAST